MIKVSKEQVFTLLFGLLPMTSFSFLYTSSGDGYEYIGDSMNYDIKVPFELGVSQANPRYTRHYSQHDLPRKFDNFGNDFFKNDAYKYTFIRGHNNADNFCTELYAKVNLPVIGTFEGQSIYSVGNEYIGILAYAGDTNRPLAVSGNVWQKVFDGWCTTSSQGASAKIVPILLKQPPAGEMTIPRIEVGEIEPRRRWDSKYGEYTGNKITKFILKSFTLRTVAHTCALTTPKDISLKLPTIAMRSLPKAGSEVYGGKFEIGLRCDNSGANNLWDGIRVYMTLTDQSDVNNRSDILSLAPESTAKGVGIRLYKNGERTPIKYGPDSNAKGVENQWQFSNGVQNNPQVEFQAYYVNANGNITPGTVKAIATYTFSYR